MMASNNLIPPWIASYVERCLKCYIGQETSGGGCEVEDNGTCLNIRIHQTSYRALVADWGTGPTGDGAVLIDTNNQIDGILSKESLAALNASLPVSKSPKRHSIELLDFTLVVTYSDPSPDVRLYVSRFEIDWQGGEHKFTPKRKVKKHNIVKVLLDQALQRVQDSRQTHQFSQVDPQPAKPSQPEVEASPLQQSQLIENGSQLFSQIPASQKDSSDESPRFGSSLLQTGTSLLRHLNSFSATSIRGVLSPKRPPKQPPSDPGTPIANDHLVQETINPPGSQNSREASAESQIRNDFVKDLTNFNSQMQEGPSFEKIHSPATLVSQTNDGIGTDDDAVMVSPSRKRRRRSSEEAPVLDTSEEAHDKSFEGHTSNKRQKKNFTQDISVEPISTSATEATESSGQKKDDPNTSLNTSSSANPGWVNPWKWVGGIPLREVKIGKKQAEFFENNKRWIPAAVGDPSPPGHVPPSLLKQWNEIAKQRHESAEEDKTSLVRPVTPKEQHHSSSESDSDTGSEDESLPWSPSPERDEQTIQRLPADSSPLKRSPEGQKPPTREEFPEVDADKILDKSNDTNHPAIVESGSPQPTLGKSGPDGSTDFGSENIGTTAQSSSAQDAEPEIGEASNQGSRSVSEEISQVETSARRSAAGGEELTSPGNAPEAYAEPFDTNESGDESDESMMDTSVPLALGGSLPGPSQSTQNDQEPGSSGHSLPTADAAHIQVFETPAMYNGRLPGIQAVKEPGKTRLSHRSDELSSSCPQIGSSSQSRVLNTYPANGNPRQFLSSSDETHSSAPSKISVQVNQTQPHPINQNDLSQDAGQSQTQSEIVLDSSGPAQRQQNTSQSGSKSITESSSHPSTSSHQPMASQPIQPTQDSMAGLSSLDQSLASQLSPLARFMPGLNDDSSPSKVSIKSPGVSMGSSQVGPLTQSAGLVTRRLGYLDNPIQLAEAHGVYEKFSSEYSQYTGDFTHFVELCLKLKAIRAGGKLQRSYLWDDFIIMHLTRFPVHVQERASRGIDPLSYEDYFVSVHTYPVHKKRCLTISAIDAVSSQASPSEVSSQVTNAPYPSTPSASQNRDMGVSFTASLVDHFSNFNTHSFNENSPNGLPPADISSRILRRHTREPSVEIKREHSEELESSGMLDTQALPLSSYEAPPFVKRDPDSEEHLSLGSCIANTQETKDIIMEEPKDIIMEDARESSPEEEFDEDEDDTFHETASVELGDETFVSKSAEPSNDNVIPETDSEAESEEENWFMALRRSRVPVPSWSDDPNTPFKRWAEADQNILRDRRRRKGSKILLDAKGVVRRPIHR